jgi:hypothetical protein
LSTKAGVNGHHQQQINLFEMRLDGANRRGRIDGEADFLAQRFYFLN